MHSHPNHGSIDKYSLLRDGKTQSFKGVTLGKLTTLQEKITLPRTLAQLRLILMSFQTNNKKKSQSLVSRELDESWKSYRGYKLSIQELTIF